MSSVASHAIAFDRPGPDAASPSTSDLRHGVIAGSDGAALSLRGVSKAFGGVHAVEDIDLDVGAGEIRAIIGPNGAGKTTLINLVSGLYRTDAGTISFGTRAGHALRARDLARAGIQRTFQNLALFDGLSVEENIAMGRTAARRATTFERMIGSGRVRRERDETRLKVDAVLDFLEIDSIRDQRIGNLPYGLRKRVEFARAIVGEPRLLILDEPMAGTGAEEKQKLAAFIRATRDTFGTSVLLIEHDVGIVMRLADRIAVLDHGRKIADGTPDEVRRDQAVIDAYLGVDHGEPAA